MYHKSSLAGRIGCYFLIFLASLPILRRAQAAGVALYRCDVGGVLEFRQTACEQGDESTIHVNDSSRGMTPSEPGLRLKKASEKSDIVSRQREMPAVEARCWKKRTQLDRVERRLRSGYKPSQYQRLHQRQDEYEAYIRHFCR
jgi:hypothetical protein